MSQSKLSLKTVVVPSMESTFDFPGFKDFKLTLCFLSREEVVKLQKAATRTKINRSTRKPEEEFDGEVFMELYVGALIKGWQGLKVKYLIDLVPMDASDLDLEDTLEYSPEEAMVLMKNSSIFDNFVTDTVQDLQNFTKASSK